MSPAVTPPKTKPFSSRRDRTEDPRAAPGHWKEYEKKTMPKAMMPAASTK